MAADPLAGALFTDLYELTMAAAYHRQGIEATATFSVFVRDPERRRNYFVAAGLETLLHELENYRFLPEDLAYLESLKRFDASFLERLAALRFSGDVHAMPEGTLFFPEEPVVEISAPIIEAQVIETLTLNTLGLASLIASKAARCTHAAQGRPLVDFALRRTHGQDAGDQVARSTYLAGFAATSNVRAGKHFGIPVSGTMAHSFVSAFPSEIEAFRSYAQTFPDDAILLIDTYDTLAGARHAAQVGLEMRACGHALKGVRLDSGDILMLSRDVRRILDAAGLPEAMIYASSGFDEYQIDALLEAQAPIDAFGVGTKVGVSADAPYLDIVYKLVRLGTRDVRKLSPGKQTLAGIKQVFRRFDTAGRPLEDIIARRNEVREDAEALLQPVMSGGRRLVPPPSLIDIRRRFGEAFQRLPQDYKSIRRHAAFPVRISAGLQTLQDGPANREPL
jgi:nicotinate phosphoribosyltransferase